MTGASPTSQSEMESLLSWWQLAGVEDFCADQPVNWLEAPPAPPRRAAANRRAAPGTRDGNPSEGTPPKTVAARPAASAPAPSLAPPPATLEALHDRLRRADDLPGTAYGSMRALPHGAAEAPLMIISDCPDDDDLAAATILSGATGALLRNMLSAIGIDLASCYRASLSVSRPASGRLPPQDFAPLADAMRHHIALVQPQNLLLLGTGPSEALLGQTIQHARDGLHEFNQKSGKMALIATYHPRTLLKRPQCKRPAWEDLQKLLKVGRW